MEHRRYIKITVSTELQYLRGGIYKPYVELSVFDEGVRMMVEPIATMRGDDLPYADAMKQLGELTKQITVVHQEAMNQRIDELLAEIAKE